MPTIDIDSATLEERLVSQGMARFFKWSIVVFTSVLVCAIFLSITSDKLSKPSGLENPSQLNNPPKYQLLKSSGVYASQGQHRSNNQTEQRVEYKIESGKEGQETSSPGAAEPKNIGLQELVGRAMTTGLERRIITRIEPESGIPGSSLYIRCSDIKTCENVEVFINGNPAKINSVSMGKLEIIIPEIPPGRANIEALTKTTCYRRMSAFNVLSSTKGPPYYAHPQTVTDELTNGHSLRITDIDQDGDLDIVFISSDDQMIYLLENADGTGHFGATRVIGSVPHSVASINVGDIDSDGDPDLYFSSAATGEIIWLENSGKHGEFGAARLIETGYHSLHSVHLADLDCDHDLDFVVSETETGRVGWLKNIDGYGNFIGCRMIAEPGRGSKSVATGDLNSDGYLDVICASSDDNLVAWYVNLDGHGNFSSPQTISNTVAQAALVLSADLDMDGTMDVISASWADDKIGWYNNRDGRGVFSSQRVISSTPDDVRTADMVDFDGDGDLDVLTCTDISGNIIWFENEQNQDFLIEHTVTDERIKARFASAGDIDNDGDVDVVAITKNGDQILLFKQLSGYVSNNARMDIPRSFNLAQNYPNPFNPSTTIRYSLAEACNVQLTVFDEIGHRVTTLVDGFQRGGHHPVIWNGRDASDKPVGSGIYFYKIKAGYYQETKKMILVR